MDSSNDGMCSRRRWNKSHSEEALEPSVESRVVRWKRDRSSGSLEGQCVVIPDDNNLVPAKGDFHKTPYVCFSSTPVLNRKPGDNREAMVADFLANRASVGSHVSQVLSLVDDDPNMSYCDLFLPGLDPVLINYYFQCLNNHQAWHTLHNRQTAWFSKCKCYYNYSGLSVPPQPFPPWLSELTKTVTQLL